MMHAETYLAGSILPAAVQTRLPALQALRKSISWTEIFIVPVPRLSRSLPTSQKSSPPTSPPLNAVAANGNSNSRHSLDIPLAGLSSEQDDAARDQPRHSSQQTTGVPLMPSLTPLAQDCDSGVKWKYAQQGSMLHALGTQSGNDVAFTRKSYIDGVSYLLKALPDDLDEHEAAVIEQSLPAQCLERTGQRAVGGSHISGAELQYDQQQNALVPFLLRPSSSSTSTSSLGYGQAEPLFRRAVRRMAMQFVLLMYLLGKLLMVLVRLGAEYEKRYNISQHVVSQGVVLASALGKGGVAVGVSVAQLGEGRLGQALTQLGAWAAEIVTGGIRDGFTEGFEIISGPPPQPSARLK